MITRRSLALATAGIAIATAARAQGQWPEKPVRLIIGYPAGGPTDFGGRLLQDPLGRLWGQPLVIENRAGASQIIASEAVARSPADGYTLFLAASTHASNAAVYARLPYDTLNDFTPIVNPMPHRPCSSSGGTRRSAARRSSLPRRGASPA